MIVEISDRARADLSEIARWVARDNPSRARSFSLEIREKCLALSRLPRRFPVARVIGGRQIRKRTHGRYLIFYEVRASRVYILRVVHGARDWVSLLDAPD